jgi:hypothetical protein
MKICVFSTRHRTPNHSNQAWRTTAALWIAEGATFFTYSWKMATRVLQRISNGLYLANNMANSAGHAVILSRLDHYRFVCMLCLTLALCKSPDFIKVLPCPANPPVQGKALKLAY